MLSANPLQTDLTLEQLSLLDSLSNSELGSLLSTVSQSQSQKLLEQLAAFQSQKTALEIRAKLPLTPHPRQSEFLNLTCEDALFGGAAGGGKSEALLMWLAEGVGISGYTGGIFRRHIEDLTEGEGSILAKSMRMYPAIGGRLVGLEWIFDTKDGGTSRIVMSGIAHEKSVLKQQGKEFHRIAFDEMTHFTEGMVDFVYTTRVRKVVGFPIKCGMRGSANPGGPGHDWVLARYITKEALDFGRNIDKMKPTPKGTIFYGRNQDGSENRDIAYVPSRAIDNPTLDLEDYLKRLAKNKNPVERARMMNGDWSVAPEGLIKKEWLRYYRYRSTGGVNSMIVELLDTKLNVIAEFDVRECRKFMTGDTAGGMKDITRESKGKNLSWTVFQNWGLKRFGGNNQALLLFHCWRDRVGFTEVAQKVVELHKEFMPQRIKVENATMGPALVDLLKHRVPISLVSTESKDKVARAFDLLTMLQEGQVYLPLIENSWKPTLEAEWLSWQGQEEETNDQVDAAAYAAMEAGRPGRGIVSLPVSPKEMQKTGSGEKPFWS